MKKKFVIILSAVISLAVLAGCSKGYVSEKNSSGLTIRLKADRYPLIKSDNKMTLIIIDSTKKTVIDAKVDVRFYMPPMPGMAPMDSMTHGELSGDKYYFTVNPAMEGGWKLDAIVTQAGRSPVTTTFNLDAR